MIDLATAQELAGELGELDVEARAWFAEGGDADGALLARALPRLLSSSRLALDRPDRCNVFEVRIIAGLPPAWGDARTFACLALAALQCVGDELATAASADAAAALRYVAAARDALRLAELADVAGTATRAATAAREAGAFDRLQDMAQAWRALGAKPWKVKVPAIAQSLGVSEKTVERWHAEAVRLGLPLDPLDPRV